jgi:hypothetical protein
LQNLVAGVTLGKQGSVDGSSHLFKKCCLCDVRKLIR